MAIKVFIPTPLRVYTERKEAIDVEGSTVEEVLTNLVQRYAQLRQHLYNDDGRLRSYVNIYVNDEDIRYLLREKTPLRDNDTLSIIPSIAGGNDVESQTTAEDVHLSNEEILRYSRHLLIPEVGVKGQKKLKAAKVLIIGAGGLGSPLGLYLAAAGVGTIGFVDFDTVDLTNLQRQVIYGSSDVGKPKLQVAINRLMEVNPNVNFKAYQVKLTSENAMEIFSDYDVIVDGTDNFPTRYLVNDACVLSGKAYVYGSIFRFEGQVTVFDARSGPCYRCLYPSPPPPGLVPSCAEGGVLGVLPGIIGSLQALETIKLIIGGETLVGRLVLFDALKFKFRELKLRKDPECPICGQNRKIHELIDYEHFCGLNTQELQMIEEEDEIMVEDLKAKMDRGDNVFILDVREPNEYEIVNIGGYLIPLPELPYRFNEIDRSKEIIVCCKYGIRSREAVEFLREVGFKNAKNLSGGIIEWVKKIDKTLPLY